MPKRKKTKKSAKRIIKRTKRIAVNPMKAEKRQNFWSKVKWGESYTSFILGLVVVIVSFVLIVSFLRNSNTKTETIKRETSSISTSQNAATQENANSEKTQSLTLPITYTIKPGDTLWSIAENFYKSGYNWVDIAKTNNLEDPGLIHSGNKLIIPNVKPVILRMEQKVSKGEVSSISNIVGNTYTVEKDDNLWDISLRAYGDGFKWIEIAKANKLVNPSLIHPGNIFKIPR